MNASLLQEYVSLVLEKIRTKKGVDSKFGDKFDLKKFKSLPSSEVMIQYAKTFLDTLGQGSSRRAFLLSGKYALKIALNAKGISQNQAELDVFTNPKSKAIVAKVYDADDEFNWVISDLVRPLKTPEEFEQLTKIPWEKFTKTLVVIVKHHVEVRNLPPFLDAVAATAQQNNLLVGDLKEIDHWGKTHDGRCVLLDYGFTQEVWASHYSDKPSMTGKTADSDVDTKNRPVDSDEDGKKTTEPNKKQKPAAAGDNEIDRDERTGR